MAQKATKAVGEAYKAIIVPSKLQGQNIREAAARQYPTGYKSLEAVEDALNSYEHDETEYQALCNRYVNGWTQLFHKLVSSVSVKPKTQAQGGNYVRATDQYQQPVQQHFGGYGFNHQAGQWS